MQDIDFNTTAVLLRGSSLTGQLAITNKNQNLSIMYEIVSIPARFLDVVPDRGIIMSQQCKKIRVRLPTSTRNSLSISHTKMELVIHTTMNSEYNRKIMKQRNMQGWSQVQNTFETFKIPVVLGNGIGLEGQEMIKDSRKSGYSNSNIKSYNQQDYIRNSIQKRRSLSKIHSRNLQTPNKDGSLRNAKLNNQLNFIAQKERSSNYLNIPAQSDVNNLARLDIRQSLRNSNRVSPLPSGRNYNGEFILTNQNLSDNSLMKQSKKSQNPLQISIGPYNQDQNDQLRTVNSPTVTINSPLLKGVITSSPKSNQSNVKNRDQGLRSGQEGVLKQQSQRGLQILILAIIAGFFLALGSNIGRLFS